MKKALTVLLSCAVLTGLVGCGTKDVVTGQADQQPAASQNEEIPGLFHKAESNGLEVIVKASKIKYKPGEEMIIQAHIRNTTQKTMFLQTHNGCDTGVNIFVPINQSQFALVPEGEAKHCIEMMGVKELKPDQTITHQVKLQAKDDVQQQNVKAGAYEIKVSVDLTSMDHGMMNTEPPQTITISAPFTVVE
ncbi:hypothetical protein CIG75_10500 [Tumebacillus algifaecis]|uniref:Intracellular proteinase inhibitor BsuPI domain-containing protein n=1 Tax=Tumebacillus algifaecis TaxID=1214604 RepID=A0A223D152_9BACL|nr:hypothetical protein [Tumebacillus algifaecis]ASS75378.1 hypothetical protein CIG75_10500 [Tumebacillus algifaecis]